MMKIKSGNMNLSGHLRELRNRVVIILLTLCGAFMLLFQFADNVVEHLTNIGQKYGYEFIYLSPQDLFLQYMKIGFIGAICVASPVILYQIARFIAPALKKNENIVMFLSMTFGFLFFLIGVFFAYEITVPFMLNFFVSVNTSSNITAMISVSSYLSMLITVFLVFGIVFELPVVSVILTQLGFLKPQWMVKARPVAIVVIFIVGAFITPPDIVSQCLIAGPMIVLYQLSIYLCKIFYKRRKKDEVEEDDVQEEEESDKDK